MSPRRWMTAWTALLLASGFGIAQVGPHRGAAFAAVGAPTWWSGDCDANHWNAAAASMGWRGAGAQRLGASYLGVPVCGPLPSLSHAPDVLWSRGGWGEYEWECTELVFRFMSQIYGVSAYGANGVDVVNNYTSADGGKLEKILNSTFGVAPRPGDVISFSSPSNGAGHAAVVSASDVDVNGDGTLTLLTQNDTANGSRTLAVSAWTVASFGDETPTAWLHDPAGRADPGAPASPPASPVPSASPSPSPSPLPSPSPSPLSPVLTQSSKAGQVSLTVTAEPSEAGDSVIFFVRSGMTGKVRPLGESVVASSGDAVRNLALKPGQILAIYSKLLNGAAGVSPYSNDVRFRVG